MTTGAAHGAGIYLSTSATMSMGYARMGHYAGGFAGGGMGSHLGFGGAGGGAAPGAHCILQWLGCTMYEYQRSASSPPRARRACAPHIYVSLRPPRSCPTSCHAKLPCPPSRPRQVDAGSR